MDMLLFKVENNGEFRRFDAARNVTLQELKGTVAALFNLATAKFMLAAQELANTNNGLLSSDEDVAALPEKGVVHLEVIPLAEESVEGGDEGGNTETGTNDDGVTEQEEGEQGWSFWGWRPRGGRGHRGGRGCRGGGRRGGRGGGRHGRHGPPFGPPHGHHHHHRHGPPHGPPSHHEGPPFSGGSFFGHHHHGPPRHHHHHHGPPSFGPPGFGPPMWGGAGRGRGGCGRGGKRKKVRFVKHVTYNDGSVVAPGEYFEKTWRVRNDDSEAWPEDVHIQEINGEFTCKTTKVNQRLQPGQVTEVSVKVVSPLDPGNYRGFWRLTEGLNGKKFGQRLWCEITVRGSSSSSSSSSSESSSSSSESSSESENEDAGFSGDKRLARKKRKAIRKVAHQETKVLRKLRKIEQVQTKLRDRLKKIRERKEKLEQSSEEVGSAAAGITEAQPDVANVASGLADVNLSQGDVGSVVQTSEQDDSACFEDWEIPQTVKTTE